MYKIAVLGDYDSIFGFAALGLDTFAVQTREEAAERKISGTGHTGDHSDPGYRR